MKPKFRSLAAAFYPLTRSIIVVVSSLAFAVTADAAKTWSGATDANWATTTNWVEGALPGTTETVVFDANSTLNLSAIALGANRTVRGINLTSPASDVTIAAGSTLTLGVNGISLVGATQNLALNCGVAIDTGRQIWNVPAGRSVITAAAPTRGTDIAGVAQFNTTGTIKLGSAASALVADTQSNAWGNFGTNDWAALDASGNVIAATYTPATTGITHGVINDIQGNIGVISSTALINAIRFDSNTVYNLDVANSGTARTATVGGILVTANCAGGSIGGNGRTNAFIRPNRSSGGGIRIFNVIQNSAADFTIGAVISNSSSSTATLHKSGTGKLIVTGNAGYTSGTRISEGTLQFGAAGASGFPGSGDITNNSSLIFSRSDTVTLIHNILGTGSFTQAGPGELDLTTSVSTFTGPVNIIGGTLGVTTMNNLGAGTAINIENGATFKFLSNIDPSVRSMVIGSTGASLDTNGFDISLGSAFASGSTGSLTKKGAGKLTLSTANDYSGGTNVNGGTLLVNASGAVGSGALTVNTGGTLAGTGSVSATAQVTSGGALAPGNSAVGTLTVGGLTLDSGSAATYEFNNTPSNDQVAVSVPGGLTINGGAITLVQEGTATPFTGLGTYNLISYSGSISGSGVSSLSVANAQPGYTYGFSADGSNVKLTIGAAGVVSKWITDGSGSWATGSNWDNGVPDGSGATANLTTSLSAPATISLNGGKTVGALTFNSATNGYTVDQGSGGSLTINNGVSAAAITNNGGIHVISAPVILSSNTGLTSATAAEKLSFEGVVSGSGNLTKAGPGELVLSGSNTFNGLLTLSEGKTMFASGGLGAGNLDISGATLVWASGNTQDISNRTITFGENTVTFDTNGNDVSLANSFGEFGNAGLTKSGMGKLTIADEGAFAGATTINGGILQLGSGGTTGTLNGNIVNNAELVVSRSDSFTLGNLISGTGSLEIMGGGTIQLSAANTFSGTTTITSGGINLMNPLALQNSTLNYQTAGGSLSFGAQTVATLGGLSGDKNLTLENADSPTPAAVALTVGGNNGSTTYTGVLSGSGSLVKTGTGTLTLGAANTYAGTTTSNGGVLEIDLGAAVNSSNAVTTSGTGQVAVTGGSMSVSTGNFGVSSGGFLLNGGSTTFSGTVTAAGSNGSNASALIKVIDGVLTAPSIVLGRTFENINNTNTPNGPNAAAAERNLYIVGGQVNISGDLLIGTASNVPNSTVITRVDGGALNVAGAVSVGLNNGDRWSMLDINGGEFNSTATAVDSGVVLGGDWQGRSAFIVRGTGIAKVERVQMGKGTLNGSGLVNLLGGELYVGSGGIVLGTTGTGFVSEVRLNGGTLAAKANWSTNFPVTMPGASFSTIKAADSSGNPFNITLNGLVSGTGSIDKTGAGMVTLVAGNTSTGSTTVMEGVLKVQAAVFDDACTIGVEAGMGAALNLDFTGGDRVGVFEIDGVPQADGIYGAIGSGAPHETAAITGAGLLYVNTSLISSPYATWANANGLTTGVNDGTNDDPDNDGISNVLEFVLGGNPLASSTSILPTVSASGSNFVFTFNRSDESESEVALTFQHGTNLTGWTNVSIPAATAGSVAVTENGVSPDTVVVTIPKGANTKLFGRLEAVK